jgi:hypothetical protein
VVDAENPLPETTLAIILGASEFPRANLTASEAFRNSAAQVRAYLIDPQGFGLPWENLLDLFNAEDVSANLNDKIVNFLKARATEMKSRNQPARDLLVYYVGHGGFTEEGEYFLAIRDTRSDCELLSSFPIKALAKTLKEHIWLRRYLILDCCFAAQAYSAFQSDPLPVACRQTMDEFPKKGTALLCASSRHHPAIILPSQDHTMFSGALLHILRQGYPEDPEKFSLATVGVRTRDLIKERHPSVAVRPEVHSPDQREGDVAILPLFPNPARRKEEMKAAVSRLDALLVGMRKRQDEQEAHQRELTSSLENLRKSLEKFEHTIAKAAVEDVIKKEDFKREFLTELVQDATIKKIHKLGGFIKKDEVQDLLMHLLYFNKDIKEIYCEEVYKFIEIQKDVEKSSISKLEKTEEDREFTPEEIRGFERVIDKISKIMRRS